MQSERISFGAKKLSDDELKYIFPQFQSLLDEVENVRAINNALSEIEQDYKEANNTFSILGGRGTGKTSILYSIKRELEKGVCNKFCVCGNK